MRIQVKLGGELKRYADNGTVVVDSDGPLTLAETMERIGLAESADEVLVIVNEEVVPPASRTDYTVRDDDRVTVMPQLKGG